MSKGTGLESGMASERGRVRSELSLKTLAALAAAVAAGSVAKAYPPIIWDGAHFTKEYFYDTPSIIEVHNGLSFENDARLRLFLGFGSTCLYFPGVQTISGNGEITLNRASLIVTDGGTLTIDPGITVGYEYESGSILGPVINKGTLRGISVTKLVNEGMLDNTTVSELTGNLGSMIVHDGKQIRVDGDFVVNKELNVTTAGRLTLGGSWTNNSLINVVGPRVENLGRPTLTLDGNWDNKGVINATDAIVNLGGSFSFDKIGTLNRAGSEVNIVGTLDNIGRTLTLNAQTGSWRLTSGTIRGGTVTATDGARLTFDPNYSTNSVELDGVTLATDVSMAGGIRVTVRNGLTLAGSRLTVQPESINSSPVMLQFQGDSVLGGNGEIIFGTGDYGGTGDIVPVDGTLTVGPGITIRATTFSHIGSESAGLINRGLISSSESRWSYMTVQGSPARNEGVWEVKNHGTLGLGGNWTNAGVLRVDNGQLYLGGTFKMADLGTFERKGGTVSITGTLDNRGQVLRLNETTGSWYLTSGTILGGTIASGIGGAALQVSPGDSYQAVAATLDGVTLDTELVVPSAATLLVKNGLSLAPGSRIRLETDCWSALKFQGDQTLGGSGEIVFNCSRSIDGPGPCSLAGVAGTLTIGPGVTIRTGTSNAVVGDLALPFINQGTISAQGNYRTINMRGSPVANQGILEAKAGGILTLDGTWTNTGTLRVADGTLVLGGKFATVDIGRISRTGGTICIAGTLDNSGSVLDMAASGSLQLGDYRRYTGQIDNAIIGGTIRGSDDTELLVGGPSRLENVTVNSPITIQNGGLLQADGATVIGGHRLRLQGDFNNATLQLGANASIADNVEVVFDGSYNNNFIKSGRDLVLGLGTLVRSGVGGGTIDTGDKQLINRGTIWAGTADRTITLAGRWRNEGLLKVTDGILCLSGNYANADLGRIEQAGGIVQLSGTIDNTNAILKPGTAGAWELARATIRGGTLAAADVKQFFVAGQNNTLDGVTLQTGLTMRNGSSLIVPKGLMFGENASITGIGSFTIDAVDDQILGGTGTISFGDSYDGRVHSSRGTLTIAPGITIRSGLGGGYVGNWDYGVVNQGTIISETRGHEIWFHGSNQGSILGKDLGSLKFRNLHNSATIAATGASITKFEGELVNTGSISLADGNVELSNTTASFGDFKVQNAKVYLKGPYTTAQIRGIQATGSEFWVSENGVLDNRGQTLFIDPANAQWHLYGGKIVGGTISGPSESELRVHSGANALENVVLDTDVLFDKAGELTIRNGIALGRPVIIRMSADSRYGQADLCFDGSQTLASGQVVFESDSSNTVTSINGTLTLGRDAVIRTGKGSGRVGYSRQPLINQGLISAETAGKSITVDGSVFANEGTLQAVNGGVLTVNLNSNWSNIGLIRVDNATLNLGGTFRADQVGSLNRSNATVNIIGTLDNTGSTLPLDAFGGWNLGTNGKVAGGTVGNLADTMPLRVVGDGTLDGVAINADIQIGSGASLTLLGNWSNNRTIRADHGILNLGGSPAQVGNISLVSSNLALFGNYTTAQVKAIASSEGILIVAPGGTLDNTNNELVLGGAYTQAWLYGGGRLVGGTITGSGEAKLWAWGYPSNQSTLDGVTLAAPFLLDSTSVLVQNGLVMQGKPMTIGTNGSTATVTFKGNQTLGGTGEIVLDGSYSASTQSLRVSNGTLTIGPGITIRTGSGSGQVGSGYAGGGGVSELINQGIISARDGRLIQIYGTSFSNLGTLEARDGGMLTFNGGTQAFKNLSNGVLSGGTWAVYGSSQLVIPASVSTNAATIILSGAGAKFTGLELLERNAGSLTIANGYNLAPSRRNGSNTTAIAFTNEGTMTLGPGSTFTSGAGFTQTTGTIGGSGTFKNTAGPALIGGKQTWADGASMLIEGGTLQLDSDAGSSMASSLALKIAAGARGTFNAPQHLQSLQVAGQVGLAGGGESLLQTRSLSIVDAGQLDLNDNALIVQATAPTREQVLTQISGWIKSGQSTSGNRWQGPGIISSAARDNRLTGLAVILNDQGGRPILDTFAGQGVDVNSVLVKYTWNGDANLDGIIDASDYFLIDSGFITQRGGYRNGDFNFDGVVDASDYFLIDSAFIGQTGVMGSNAAISTAVPEPTAAGLLALTAIGLLGRRQRTNPR